MKVFNMGLKVCTTFVLFSLVVPHASASQDEYEVSAMSAEQALEKGRLMRAQYKNLESRVYLKQAADKDSAAGSFLYAMELNNYKTNERTPLDTRQYLLKAGELGNRRAMYQLYRHTDGLRKVDVNFWRSQYYTSVILLGRDKPAQAMYELARFHRDYDEELSSYYLDKAIEFKHPLALMERADSLVDRDGSAVLSGEISDKAESLYLLAAETEYIPAMKRYIEVLESTGRYEDAYQWRERALQNGDITSLAVMAKILIGQSSNYSFVPSDKVTAKAYMDLYLSSAGRERMTSLYSVISNDEELLSLTINAEEKEQALDIYLKFKKTIKFYNHDKLWDIQ